MNKVQLTKINILFTLSIIFFLPLIFDNNLFLKYELPKLLLFRILVEINVLLLLFFDKSFLDYLLGFFYRYKWQITFFIVILFASYASSYSSEAFFWGTYYKRFGLFTILHLILFGLILNRYLCFQEYYKELKRYFRLVGLVSFILIFVYAVFQYSFTNVLLLTEGRWTGSFGQANFFGNFYLFLLPFFLFSTRISNRKIIQNLKENFSYVLGLMVSYFAIYMSQSRISIFLSVLLLLYYMWSIFKFKYKFTKVKTQIILLVIVLILLTSIFNSRIMSVKLGEEFRFQIWRAGISLVRENPFLGLGFDNIIYHLPDKLSEFGYKEVDGTNLLIDRTHNEYIDLLIYLGIPVGGLLVWTLFQKLQKSIAFRKEGLDKFQKVSLASLFLVLINSFVNTNSIWNYIFFVFLLVIISKRNRLVLKKQFNLKVKMFSMFVVSVCLVLSIFINVMEYASEYNFKKYLETKNIYYLEKAYLYNPKEEMYRKYLELKNGI